MKKLITVRQVPENPALLGGMLGAPSFGVMRTLLIAAMGEPLTAAECRSSSGRTETPAKGVEELWIIAVFFYRALELRHDPMI